MSKKPISRKRRIVRRIIAACLILVLLAAAGFAGYMMLRQKYTVTYTSYTAATGSISNSLSFSGNLSLVDSAYYTAPSAGTVRTVYAAVGDQVKEGQKLVRLSNGSTVEAEFDGKVNALPVSEGDEVRQGDSLIQVADFSHMKVSVRVDEYDIGDVNIGQKCSVTVTSIEKAYTSELAAIDYISQSGGSVAYYTATVYVDTEDGTLPGMQVTVSIPQEEAADVVVLKEDALAFDETNRAYVWKKDEAGELTQVFVETGVSNGNYVEIKSGLSSGDEVFAQVEQAQTNAVTGLLSGLFGNNRFPGGQGGGFSGRDGMPDMSSFDFSSIPGGGSGGFSFGDGGGSGGPGGQGGFGGRGGQ